MEQARRVVQQAHDLVEQVRIFDRSQRTISIGSCAPAPLWELVSLVSQLYPEMTVSSEMKGTDVLLDGLKSGVYQFIILPFASEEPEYCCFPFEKEQLYFPCRPLIPFPDPRGSILRTSMEKASCCFPRSGFGGKFVGKRCH